MRLDKGVATRGEGRDVTHPTRKKGNTEELRTTSVHFVEQTRGGSLETSLKKVMERLTPMLGFKIKIVENAGTRLQHILYNTNSWAGRKDCNTFELGGDTLPECTKRNARYESRCMDCNSGEEVTDDLSDRRPEASIYVGETCCSIYERSKEHLKDYKDGQEDSHMEKHCTITQGR